MVSKDKLDSWRWRGNPNKCYVFWSLLFKANYKPEGFEKITVERGQLVFSYDKLSSELGVPLQTLRTTLKDLVSTGDIAIQPTRRWSLLTICEYDSWQNFNNPTNTLTDTQTDTLTDTNQINNKEYIYNTPFNNPPSGDRDNNIYLEEFERLKKELERVSEENKKLKEEKEKSKKKKNAVFTPPTKDEVAAYILEQGYHFDAEHFINFYTSKGWMVGKNKMKDWKAACGTWEKIRKNNGGVKPDEKQEGLPMTERFTNWVIRYYPCVSNLQMPTEDQLKEMLNVCDNHIEGCLDQLQGGQYEGSLYDLFMQRFGGN